MNVKLLLFFFLILTAQPATLLAQTQVPRQAINVPEDSPLWADVSPQVQTISRDITLFHWGRASYVGVGESRPGDKPEDALKNFLERKVAYYFALNSNQGFRTGNSLYMIVDPASTKGFGGSGDDFALLKLQIKKGSRFISMGDLNSAHPTTFSTATVNYLESQGCHGQNIFGLFDATDRACHAVAVDLIRKLHIGLVAYNYGTRLPSQCENKVALAFVLTDPSIVDLGKTHRFIHEVKKGEDIEIKEDRNFVSTYLKMLGWNDDSLRSDKAISTDKFQDRFQHEILGCGHYPEDKY